MIFCEISWFLCHLISENGFEILITLQWRYNEHNGVSNLQPHLCLLKCFFQEQIKVNIKALRHWPLCGEFTSHQWIPRTNGQWHRKCFHLMMSLWTKGTLNIICGFVVWDCTPLPDCPTLLSVRTSAGADRRWWVYIYIYIYVPHVHDTGTWSVERWYGWPHWSCSLQTSPLGASMTGNRLAMALIWCC